MDCIARSLCGLPALWVVCFSARWMAIVHVLPELLFCYISLNSFFVGRLESVGLGFSIRISVMVSGYFSRQKSLACLPWIFMKNSRNAFAYFPWIFTTYNTSRWQVCELSRLCMWAVHSMTCPVRELAIVHKLAVCKLVLAVCALFINNAVVDSVNVWL